MPSHRHCARCGCWYTSDGAMCHMCLKKTREELRLSAPNVDRLERDLDAARAEVWRLSQAVHDLASGVHEVLYLYGAMGGDDARHAILDGRQSDLSADQWQQFRNLMLWLDIENDDGSSWRNGLAVGQSLIKAEVAAENAQTGAQDA